MKKLLGGMALVALLLLVLAWPVSAFETRSGNDVVVAAGEVIDDDLYVGASTFTLEGTVTGDVVVMGGTITIGSGGVVGGDLIAAGQSVTIDGNVHDDARIAGAVLVVGELANVGDDLVAAGYSLETWPGSLVSGSLLFGGAQALLEGDITGDATVSTNGLDLQGRIGGNLQADVGSPEDTPPFSPLQFLPDVPSVPSVPGGLTFGSGARIGGNLDYRARQRYLPPPGVVGGQVTYEQPPVTSQEETQEARPSTASRIVHWFLKNLRNLITLLLIGLLLVWLLPGLLGRAAAALRQEPLPGLGWGVVAYLVIGFAMLVILTFFLILVLFFGFLTLGKLAALAALVGLVVLGIVAVGFFLAASFGSKIVVSYLGGRLILERLYPAAAESRLWPTLLGVVILAILEAIPFLGWLINVVVVLMGLGALWLVVWNAVRQPVTAS